MLQFIFKRRRDLFILFQQALSTTFFFTFKVIQITTATTVHKRLASVRFTVVIITHFQCTASSHTWRQQTIIYIGNISFKFHLFINIVLIPSAAAKLYEVKLAKIRANKQKHDILIIILNDVQQSSINLLLLSFDQIFFLLYKHIYELIYYTYIRSR